jgi:hypothetical protein
MMQRRTANGHPILVVPAFVAILGCAAVGQPGAPAAPPPPTAPAAPAPPTSAQEAADAPSYADADALLAALESSATTLRDFRSPVTVETVDDLTGDVERRLGQVVLEQRVGEPASRRFAVVLEKYVDPTGRMDERPVRYLYADGWLTEADFRERTLQRRQLARPGEAYDPLKPGEGPVPLPIGQRADEVRSRFRVVLAKAPAHPALVAMHDGKRPLVGVVLEPRPGMADRDLRSATVWYDARSLAPCGVEARRAQGTTTVILRDPAMNAGLDDAQRALLALAAGSTEGWRVDERPLPPAPAEPKP